MNLFVDTSVWSLALRRDQSSAVPAIELLQRLLVDGEVIFTTGLVLQELLQGFDGPKDRRHILDKFSVLPFIVPDRDDHIEAAVLRNQCRRKGVQIGTIDALLAQLCIHFELQMLTTDRDFERVARLSPLRVFQGW